MKSIKLFLVSMVLMLTWSVTEVFAATITYEKSWGSEVDDTTHFRTPVALVRDKHGYMYMVDMGNHRIVKLDTSGKVIKTFGTLGNGPGQFNMPFGIAIDQDGNILIVDTGNYRIQKFDAQFQFIKSWGTKGDENGEFGFPREIAVDGQNNYYITDEFNHRIQKYTPDGQVAGVYSSFRLHAQRAGEKFGLDPREILIELGHRKVVGGQEDMIADVAAEIAAKKK